MFRWKRADSQAPQSRPRVREGGHEEVGFDVCGRPQGGELGTTEKRVWANHEEAQLCQILLGKQVASKESGPSPDGGISHSWEPSGYSWAATRSGCPRGTTWEDLAALGHLGDPGGQG